MTGCIKSHFLHTFIVVKTTPKTLDEGQARKYSVSVVCRDEVNGKFQFMQITAHVHFLQHFVHSYGTSQRLKR